MEPHNSPPSTFGIWLDHAIRSRKDAQGAWLTQKTVADAIGIKSPHLNRIIAGKGRPSAELVLRIAAYFNEDPDTLLQLAQYAPLTDTVAIPASRDPLAARLLSLVKWLLRNREDMEMAVTMWEAMARRAKGGQNQNDQINTEGDRSAGKTDRAR